MNIIAKKLDEIIRETYELGDMDVKVPEFIENLGEHLKAKDNIKIVSMPNYATSEDSSMVIEVIVEGESYFIKYIGKTHPYDCVDWFDLDKAEIVFPTEVIVTKYLSKKELSEFKVL